MSTVRDYSSKETARRLSFLERMDATTFLEATASLDELSREPRYVVDVCYCDQKILRVAIAQQQPLQAADWFELPVAALESLTPLGILEDDPAKVIVSIGFRPEFQSLAATFRQLSNATRRAADNGTAPLEESSRERFGDIPSDLADEDPGNAAPGGLAAADEPDAALGRTLANYGAVEPGSTEPPVMATMEVPGASLLLETARDIQARALPVDITAARAFLNACMTSSPRVTYGPHPGAKVPFHGARPGKDFTHVDCSGFVRETIWRATAPHFNFPDGSVVQHDWIRAQGFTRSTIDAALQQDGAIRIAFLRPQDAPSHVGHVVLVHNARTIESHGGVGPNSRAWNKAGWQAKAFVYLLTPSVS